MQGHYESLDVVNFNNAASTLRTFADNSKGQIFKFYTVASTKHPVLQVYFLSGFQVVYNPSHHLHNYAITWYVDLIQAKLPVAVTFDPTWLIPEDPALLTYILNFENTALVMDPIQVLVSLFSGSHACKRIAISITVYVAHHLVLHLLCSSGPIRPT